MMHYSWHFACDCVSSFHILYSVPSSSSSSSLLSLRAAIDAVIHLSFQPLCPSCSSTFHPIPPPPFTPFLLKIRRLFLRPFHIVIVGCYRRHRSHSTTDDFWQSVNAPAADADAACDADSAAAMNSDSLPRPYINTFLLVMILLIRMPFMF